MILLVVIPVYPSILHPIISYYIPVRSTRFWSENWCFELEQTHRIFLAQVPHWSSKRFPSWGNGIIQKYHEISMLHCFLVGKQCQTNLGVWELWEWRQRSITSRKVHGQVDRTFSFASGDTGADHRWLIRGWHSKKMFQSDADKQKKNMGMT